MTGRPPAPQFCLQFECGAGANVKARADANVSRLALALDLTPISSVILSGLPGEPFDAAAMQPLIALTQAKGIAALVQGEVQWAKDLRADGVHLAWSDDVPAAFAEARRIIGPNNIVGADAGRSRHDAMALAEAGADYIGFGIPPHVGNRRQAAERRLDLAAWWAEIFEIPVMALDVDTAEDVASLSAAQADFIAVRLAAYESDEEFSAQLTALSAALKLPA